MPWMETETGLCSRGCPCIQHTHTAAFSMGLGKARRFSAENSVDCTLLTATSQKIPSVATATCPFFVVVQLKVNIFVGTCIPNVLIEFVASN